MAEQESLLRDYVDAFLAEVRHASALGLRLVAASPGAITLELPFASQLVGDAERGLLHGGALTALLDMACGVAVASALKTTHPTPTLDIRIDHLAPARSGQSVLGHAHAYRVTRSIVFVEGAAYQDDPDRPIARCAATFARIDPSRRRFGQATAVE